MKLIVVILFILAIIQVYLTEKKAGKETKIQIIPKEPRLISINLKGNEKGMPALLKYRLEIENKLTGERHLGKLFLGTGLFMKAMNCVQLSLDSPYSGNYKIKISKGTKEFVGATLVIPQTYSIDIKGGLSSLIDLDGSMYSTAKSGFDMSEVFSVREYMPGDSLKGIHWKLSNKMDQMLIREGSFPIKNSVLVLMETGFNEHGENLKIKMEEVVAGVISVAESLIDSGIGHHIGWCDNEKDEMIFYQVSNIEELKNALPEILSARPVSTGPVVMTKYYENISENEFSRVAYVDGKIENFEKIFNNI